MARHGQGNYSVLPQETIKSSPGQSTSSSSEEGLLCVFSDSETSGEEKVRTARRADTSPRWWSSPRSPPAPVLLRECLTSTWRTWRIPSNTLVGFQPSLKNSCYSLLPQSTPCRHSSTTRRGRRLSRCQTTLR